MIKKRLLQVLVFIMFAIVYCGLLVIYEMHKIMAFFPILFLFDFCFLAGHPLFVKYVLKRKWFDECTKDNCLKIKYILLPWLVMEFILILCCPHEMLLALQKIEQTW